MDNPKKKFSQTLSDEVNFEEMDHRLACGWYVEVEGSGQRKRYLRQRKKNSPTKSASLCNIRIRAFGRGL